MFCAKCGTQLSEGTKFCGSCGASVEQNTGTTHESQVFGKKSSKKLPIIIGSIAAVVLVCILVFSNLWAIAPKAYYGKLESRNKLISLDGIYQRVMKSTEIKPFSKEVAITVSETGERGMLEEILKDLEIRAQIEYSKDQSSLYASCKYMSNVLADAIIYSDKNLVGIGLPVVYDSNFIVKKDEISKAIANLTGEEVDLDIKEIEELKKQLDADIKTLDKAISKYGKLAYENIPSKSLKITKGDEPARIYTWSSGRAKTSMELEKYKTVELKFTEADLSKIADKVLSELEKDNEVLNIIGKYALLSEKLSYGYYYDDDSVPEEELRKEIVEELKEEIADAREYLQSREEYFDEEDAPIVVSVTSIVDKKGNIVSRKIVFDDTNVITINRFHGKDDLAVTEVNISEGKLGLGDQIANLYIYDGEDNKGIRFRSEYEGTIELSYKRSEKGKNASGIDYGEYTAFMHMDGEQYIVTMTVGSSSSSKGTELYKVKVQENGRDLIAFNIQASELKSKSKIKFSKDNAIDLASADEEELQEIFYNIGSQLDDTLYELQRMMYTRQPEAPATVDPSGY